MTKAELIAYLDAVCAAETGIVACDGAISIYQRELQRVTCSDRPRAPQRETVEPPAPVEKKVVCKPDKNSIGGYILKTLFWPVNWMRTLAEGSLHEVLLGILGFICVGFTVLTYSFLLYLAFVEVTSSDLLIILPMLLVYLLGFVWFPFFIKKQGDAEQKKYEADCLAAEQEYEAACKAREQTFERNKADAETNYQRQMQVYNREIEMYYAELKVVNAAQEAVRGRIHQQEALRAELKKRLEQLYAKDVLYPNFRTLIAAYQIREYLKMGMCEELTGPTGAYAVYMNDVRTARVCDSIHELQENLVAAIGGLQSTLALELQSVQHQLGSLEQGLHANLQGITSQMQEMHRDYRLGSDTTNYCLAQANAKLARIQSGTDSIAINQYMANLKAGADAYFPPV